MIQICWVDDEVDVCDESRVVSAGGLAYITIRASRIVARFASLSWFSSSIR